MLVPGHSTPVRDTDYHPIPPPPLHLINSQALRGDAYDPSASLSDTPPRHSLAHSSLEPASSTSITGWEASQDPGDTTAERSSSSHRRRSERRDKYTPYHSLPWAAKLSGLRRLMPAIWRKLKKALHESGSSKVQSSTVHLPRTPNSDLRGQGTPLDPINEQWTAEKQEHPVTQLAELPSHDEDTRKALAASIELAAHDVDKDHLQHVDSSPDILTPATVIHNHIASPDGVLNEAQSGVSPYSPESVLSSGRGRVLRNSENWSTLQSQESAKERPSRSRSRLDVGQEDSPNSKDIMNIKQSEPKERLFSHTIRRLSSTSALSQISPRSFVKRQSRTFSRRSCPMLDDSGSHILDRVFSSLQEQGMAEDVYQLVQDGANVHAVTHEGETALHYAVRRGYSEVCGILLWAGASTHAKTKNGLDPYHYAHHAERTADNKEIRARIAKCRQHVKYDTTENGDLHRHPLSSKFSLTQSALAVLDELRRACDDLDQDSLRCQNRFEELSKRAEAAGLQPINTTSTSEEEVKPADRIEVPATGSDEMERGSWQEEDRSAFGKSTRDDSVMAISPLIAQSTADHSSKAASELDTPVRSRTPAASSLDSAQALGIVGLSKLSIGNVNSHQAYDTISGEVQAPIDQQKPDTLGALPDGQDSMVAELDSVTQQGSTSSPLSKQGSSATQRTANAPSLTEVAGPPSTWHEYLPTPTKGADPVLDMPSIAAPIAIQPARPEVRQIKSSSRTGPQDSKIDLLNVAPTSAASDLTAMATYAFQTSWDFDPADQPSWSSKEPTKQVIEHAHSNSTTSSTRADPVLPKPQSAAEKASIRSLVAEFEESTAWLSCRHNWPRNYGNSLCLEGCPPLKFGNDGGYVSGGWI